MRILSIVAVLAALVLTSGCGKKAQEPAAPKAGAAGPAAEGHATDKAATDQAAPAAAATAHAAPAAAAAVALTAAGSKFDPPLEIAQLPAGAWYCDMGTAHYASTEKKDGKCPLCHMDLKHKQ